MRIEFDPAKDASNRLLKYSRCQRGLPTIAIEVQAQQTRHTAAVPVQALKSTPSCTRKLTIVDFVFF